VATTQPIRSQREIESLKEYFLKKGEIRNYVLVTIGLNTALRISDLLELSWKDVWNFSGNCFKKYISLTEQKTKKNQLIYLNRTCTQALQRLRDSMSQEITAESYIFQSRIGNNQHIGRNRAYVLIKKAWAALGYEGNISCHSLRKSFGYHAWHNGVSPAVIMNIYNHSSMEVTKRYLSIAQDDKDDVYRNMDL
jgi:site-specific recombinase XerD